MVIVILVVFGLCLGSFINALVWRLHEQTKTKSKKKLRELSISKGRSQCPQCGHQLAAKDLTPLFSWLSLKGKCRYCKKSISWQYPFIELTEVIILAMSYAWWPYGTPESTLGNIIFVVWALIATGFLALAVYDIRWYILPDKIVLPLTFLGLAFVGMIAAQQHDPNVILGSAIGAITIFGLFYATFQFSSGKWIGGGDVKLAVLLGLLAGGFMQALLLLFLASSLGTLYALVLAALGKQKMNRKLRIPFGPFLIVACMMVVLFGVDIIDWYTRTVISV